jgi:hypothetical protein
MLIQNKKRKRNSGHGSNGRVLANKHKALRTKRGKKYIVILV